MNNKTAANKPHEKDRISQQLRHPDDLLWRQVRAAAVMEGKSMTEWVEDTIRARFAAEEEDLHRRATELKKHKGV